MITPQRARSVALKSRAASLMAEVEAAMPNWAKRSVRFGRGISSSSLVLWRA